MAGRADATLLFGVTGGGSVSGESGKLIRSQLESIVAGLNNQAGKGRQISLKLNEAATAKNFKASITTIVSGLSAQSFKKDLTLRVGKIDGTAAIKDFRAQLEAMLKQLNIDTGFSVNVTETGASSAVKETEASAKQAAEAIALMEARLNAAKDAANQLSREFKAVHDSASSLGNADGSEAATQRINELREAFIKLDGAIIEAEKAKKSKAGVTQEHIDKINVLQGELRELIDLERKSDIPPSDARQKARDAEKASLKQIKSLHEQIENYLSRNTRITGGTEHRALKEMSAELAVARNSAQGLGRVRLDELNNQFIRVTGSIKAANNEGRALGGVIQNAFSRFGGWLIVTRSVAGLIRQFRQMITTVVDVDTAMTELRRVTEETDATYNRFLDNAKARARELGATLTDTINASADFARMGYTIPEAEHLADAALIYSVIGDGIRDIGEATSNIISTMKAFRMEATEAMRIVDSFNEVGNNFAITAAGIGEALTRSASALSAAGNDIHQSIGMIVAANNVIQNPQIVGTALRTISMRLRNTAGGLEELGEEADGAAESITRLQTQLLNLTQGRIDILYEDGETFRDTYDILLDIATIWDELTGTMQADIIRLVAGIRQGNVFTALMTNAEDMAAAMETSRGALGSAAEEHAKYLDSIQGRLAIFQASFQALAVETISSDLAKGIVDIGTSVLELIRHFGGLQNILLLILSVVILIKRESLATGLRNMGNVIADLTTRARASVTALGNKTAAIRTLGVSAAATGVTLNSMLGIFGLIITALSLLSIGIAANNSATEEARRRSAEYAREQREATRSIEEHTEAYRELITARKNADGEENIKRINDEILSIQERIRDTIGSQAQDLNLVTGEYEQQLEILHEIIRLRVAEDRHRLMYERRQARDSAPARDEGGWAGGRTAYQWFDEVFFGWTSGQTPRERAWILAAERNIDALESMRRRYMDIVIDGGGGADSASDMVNLLDELIGQLDDRETELRRLEFELLELDIGSALSQALTGGFDVSDTESLRALRDYIAEIIQDGGVFYDAITDGLISVDDITSMIDRIISTDFPDIFDNLINEDSLQDLVNRAASNIILNMGMGPLDPNVLLEHFDEDDLKLLIDIDIEDVDFTSWETLKDSVDRFRQSLRAVRFEELWDSERFQDTRDRLMEISQTTRGITSDTIRELSVECEHLNGILDETGMSATFLASVLQAVAEGNAGFGYITDELLVLDALLSRGEGMLRDAALAANEFRQSLSNIVEYDTTFNTKTDALEKLVGEFEKGTVNSKTFWETARFLLGDGALAMSVEEIYTQVSNLRALFDDSTATGFGLLEGLYELQRSGALDDLKTSIERLEDGSFVFDIDHSEISELANLLNVSETSILANIDALRMFIDIGAYDLLEVTTQLREMGILTTELNDGLEEVGLVNLQELISGLEMVGRESGEISTIIDDLRANGFILFDFNSNAEDILSKLRELGIVTEDLEAGTIEVDAVQLIETLGAIGGTKDQVQDVLDTLGEESLNLTLTNVDDVDTALNNLNETSLSDLQNEVMGIGEEANDSEAAADELADSLRDVNVVDLSAVQSAIDIISQNANSARLATNDLISALNNIPTEITTTITQNVVQTGGGGAGVNGTANVSGTAYKSGSWGAKKTETALVGEVGPEIHVDSQTGTWRTVGDDGAQFASIKKGDIIFNAQQTRDLLSKGSTSSYGKAYFRGTFPSSGWGSGSGSSSGSSGAPVAAAAAAASSAASAAAAAAEILIAINEFYIAEERLRRTQEDRRRAEFGRDIARTYRERVEYTERIIQLIGEEQRALDNLNQQRRAAIYRDVNQLRAHGFAIDYDSSNDRLLVHNWERVNQLAPEMRREIDGLINSVINLNLANATATETLAQLQNEIAGQRFGLYRMWLDEQKAVIENMSLKDEDRRLIIKSWESVIAGIEAEIARTPDKLSDTYRELIRDLTDAMNSMKRVFDEIVDIAMDRLNNITRVYDTLKAAALEYAQSGFITIGMLNQIVELGPQYLAFLMDENNQLVINEQRIRAIIDARAEQLALEAALNHVESVRLAHNARNAEELNRLLFATEAATDATWDLVAANARLIGLNSQQEAALLGQINALRSIARIARHDTPGAITDRVRSEQQALEDLIRMVIDLIRHETQEQIQGIRDQVTAFNDLIRVRKENLREMQRARDFERSMQRQSQDLIRLQMELAQLERDTSGDPAIAARRRELAEQIAEAQSRIDEEIHRKYIEEMEAAYDHDARLFAQAADEKISILEDSISSHQKLWDLAIQRINEQWSTLFQDLSDYTYQHGSILIEELVETWDLAADAVQRYGSYLEALLRTQERLNVLTGGIGTGSPNVVAPTSTPRFHSGSMSVGRPHTLRDNEMVAILEKGEAVITEPMKESMYKIIDFNTYMLERFGKAVDNLTPLTSVGSSAIDAIHKAYTEKLTEGAITNNASTSIIIENVEVQTDVMVTERLDEEDIERFSGTISTTVTETLNEKFRDLGIHNKGSNIPRL